MRSIFTRFRDAFAPRNMILALALFLGAAGFATSQGFIGVFQNGTASQPSVYGIGDTLSGIYFGTGKVGPTKHLAAGSTATANLPVLSLCGTSSALGAGSTDMAGKITVGTSASNACTLTFGTTYTTGPHCIVQNATTGAAANLYTVGATSIVWSSALADSTVLYYICIAEGG